MPHWCPPVGGAAAGWFWSSQEMEQQTAAFPNYLHSGGTIRVLLRKAAGLQAHNKDGSSDPCACLKLGNTNTALTRHDDSSGHSGHDRHEAQHYSGVRHSRDPQWDETFEFEAKSLKLLLGQKLEVRRE